MRDLNSFLSQQQTGLIDSTGEFTIAADKALEKLAHSQLPDPAYWILKLAQFGTAFECSAMYVTLGRRTCRVDAALPRPVSVYQLQKGLDSVRSLDDRGLDHLVTGLRALGGMDGRRFVLRLTDLHVSEYLIYDGKKLSTRRDEVESPVLGLSLEVTHSSPWGWGALVDVVATERRAREASVLTVKSFGVPYELQLDGSSIDLFLAESSNWFSVPVSWDYFEYEQASSCLTS